MVGRILIALTLWAFPLVVLGLDTGWVELSATETEEVITGESNWLEPDKALTNIDDATTSDVPPGATPNTSYRLKILDPNGVLDELIGNTPTGIAWEVVGTGEDSGTQASEQILDDYEIKLVIGGSLVGDDKSDGVRWTDSSKITKTYGGEGDMWNTSGVTGADLAGSNAGLSIRFRNSSADTSALMSIYRVRVRVWYDSTGPTGHPWFYRR